jgi:hypothetical protein
MTPEHSLPLEAAVVYWKRDMCLTLVVWSNMLVRPVSYRKGDFTGSSNSRAIDSLANPRDDLNQFEVLSDFFRYASKNTPSKPIPIMRRPTSRLFMPAMLSGSSAVRKGYRPGYFTENETSQAVQCGAIAICGNHPATRPGRPQTTDGLSPSR